MVVEPDVPVIIPSCGSLIRRPYPSPGSLGLVPPGSLVLLGAPTPPHPSGWPCHSRLATCTTRAPNYVRSRRRGVRSTPGPEFFLVVFPHPRLSRWRWRGLPGSWGTPVRTCPALGPRGALPIQRDDRSVLPSAKATASALPYQSLSGLDHTACALAVYASQPGSPLATQDSLPAGRQPWPGGTCTRWVPSSGFRSGHDHPPLPSFSCHTAIRTQLAG